MPQQVINIGTVAGDGTGDTLRESQRKANENFSEIYTRYAPNLGVVVPTDTPAGTGINYWECIVAGTYTNFGGVVLGANSRGVIFRNSSGVFSISAVSYDITSKVNVSDVINTLVSTETAKPLSAAQGKALNDKFANYPLTSSLTSKVNVSDIVNTLSSIETTKPLSAAQGKALNDKFNDYASDAEIAIIESDLYTAITAVASGSPKGVFANLAALEGAYPLGHGNDIYVTLDNGHWYYYNVDWQDGGLYQAPITGTIKSNESLSLAQRKGDVLYGILDQYTGEEITLSKVTGTPTVDGIMIFQLGSEYFKRNFTKINSEWFGLDKTGTADCAVKIQNLFNAIMLHSVDGYFADGTYLINSTLNFYADNLNTKLTLKGSGNVIFKNGFSGDMLVIGKAGYENVQDGYGFITLEGINFNNNIQIGATAIRVRSQKHITFNNLHIYGSWSVGISLKGVYSTPKLSNVRINGSTHGIVSHGQVNNIVYDRVSLLACTIGFYAHPDSGTGLISGELDTNTFTNCDFEGNANSILIDSPHGCTALRIQNNHFENNTGPEIIINNYTSTNVPCTLQAINISENMVYQAHEIKVGNSLLGGNIYNVDFSGNKINTFTVNAVKICTEAAAISYNYAAYNNYYENDGTVQVEKSSTHPLVLEKSIKGVAGKMPIYPFEPVLPFGNEDEKGMNGEIRWDNTNLYFKTRTAGWKYIPMKTNAVYPQTAHIDLNTIFNVDENGNIGVNTTPETVGGHTGIFTIFGDNATGVVLKDAAGLRRILYNDGVIRITNASGDNLLVISATGGITGPSINISDLNTAPSSATATGTLGEIRYTSDHIYVCVATNTWKRSAITTW